MQNTVLKITNYDAATDMMETNCGCGRVNTIDCSGFTSAFNEEIGDYENFIVECECGRVSGFTMTIPIGEYEELELEETVMPFHDINTRKYLRDFIWAKREDLQHIDRNTYNAAMLAEIRATR